MTPEQPTFVISTTEAVGTVTKVRRIARHPAVPQ
jgi:hypothetical protein